MSNNELNIKSLNWNMSRPSNPIEGDCYLNINGKIESYSGSKWEVLRLYTPTNKSRKNKILSIFRD